MTQTGFRIWGNNVLLLLSLAAMLHCAAADGKTLVLLDNLNIRDTHSIFFRSLAGECEFITFSCISILLPALMKRNTLHTCLPKWKRTAAALLVLSDVQSSWAASPYVS